MTNVTATPAGTGARTLDPIELYRTMLTARIINDTLKARKTQGRFPFYIGCAGHETVAAVVAALEDTDWLSFYYRDLAGWLQRTRDIYMPLRAAYSRVTDPSNSGRNMPSHYSSPRHHILPTPSEVSGLAPFAGGVGWALKRREQQEVVAFFTGDGGAATNDFNVLLRQATVHKLPVLMVICDNHWAIMTERQAQWAGNLAAQVRAMDAISIEIDGTDALATYEAMLPVVRRLRQGEGPAFVHLHLGLLDPHSSSTDIRRYRTRDEIEETARTKDPVANLGRQLVARGLLHEADLERLHDEIKEDILRAEEQVLTEPEPTPERVLDHVIEVPGDSIPPNGPAKKMLMLDAINDGLVEIVTRDPGFFVFGQDVGSPTGGVFGATARLVKEYPGTAISSALNEQLIVGTVAGCGMVDGRARCGEIQFVDYHQSATQTLRLAARFHYQTYGGWNVPMLLRMKSGSGGGGPISDSGSGGGAFGHSNAGDNWFTSIPGAITICPATPYDAKGLLIAASRAKSPVIFLERGRLYRSEAPHADKNGAPIAELAELWNVPEGYFAEPIGVARRLRIGQGKPVATIVSWGTMLLESAIAAARFAEASGRSVELVDLRTLMPLDERTIAAAVRATNRAMVVTEEADFSSYGRHVHSWIAEHFFWDLDNPPLFISAVAAPPAPYNGPEETAFYPTAEDVQRGLEQLAHE